MSSVLWRGVWVLPIEAEHERARQADHVHDPAGRPDAQLGDRPEIGDDLADPAIPEVPGQPLVAAPPAADVQDLGPEGIDQAEQGSALVPDLVDQGGRDVPLPTIRSRGTLMIATGLCEPPGSRVRARRMAAPRLRSR